MVSVAGDDSEDGLSGLLDLISGNIKDMIATGSKWQPSFPALTTTAVKGWFDLTEAINPTGPCLLP